MNRCNSATYSKWKQTDASIENPKKRRRRRLEDDHSDERRKHGLQVLQREFQVNVLLSVA